MPDATDTAAPRTGQRDLTTGPIGKTLLAFALPTLGSSILQSLNGSINAVWIGQFLGERALAATTNANIIMFLLVAAVFALLAFALALAPGMILWSLPLTAGYFLAIPFAVATADPRLGAAMERLGLCAIPEEIDTPPIIAALASGAQRSSEYPELPEVA